MPGKETTTEMFARVHAEAHRNVRSERQADAPQKLFQHTHHTTPSDGYLDKGAVKVGHGISNVAGVVCVVVLACLALALVQAIANIF